MKNKLSYNILIDMVAKSLNNLKRKNSNVGVINEQ